MKKILFLMLMLIIVISCSSEEEKKNVGRKTETLSGTKEKDIIDRKIEKEKEFAKNRTPCDTISFQEFFNSSFEEGTYLVEFDPTITFTENEPALLYKKVENDNYVFAVYAKSKPGERNIEVKNIVGYEASFINLDSTKLGTAFFYLGLFKCDGSGIFEKKWETEIPIHGGFSSIKLKSWGKNKTPYLELFFKQGIISGYRKYNYFMIDGFDNLPHLMETYEGISKKRTLATINEDKFPDYYEFRFSRDDTGLVIRMIDSIPFYWDSVKNLYITDYSERYKSEY